MRAAEHAHDQHATRTTALALTQRREQHDQAWLLVREARARAREAHMWDPAAFHRAQPSTLHRTPDRARDDPPPKEVEVLCYIPRAVARAHNYGHRTCAEPAFAQGATAHDQGPAVHGPFVDDRANAATAPAGEGRYATFVQANATDPQDVADGHPVPYDANQIHASIRMVRNQAQRGNVTWFHPRERRNPIYFWEQRVRCYHCGCDHYVPAQHGANGQAGMQRRCCQDGASIFHRDHAMPDAILDQIAYGVGCSSCSLALNNEVRLCAPALPRGTHRLADEGGGLKVSGVTFAVVQNVAERGAARMFLEDGAARMQDDSMKKRSDARPCVRSTLRAILEDNPFYEELTQWHQQPTAEACLTLMWEGNTSALRALSVNPAAADVLPRTTLILSRAEVDRRKMVIKATNDLYPLVMWPLAFPLGRRLRFEDGACVDQWLSDGGRDDGRTLNLQQATLMLILQPERRDASHRDARRYPYGQSRPNAFVLVPMTNPYNVARPNPSGLDECETFRPLDVWRRANRFALLGKLGDEFMLDRWMSVLDHRRDVLTSKSMQRRLMCQVADDDSNDITYDAAEAGVHAGFDDAHQPDGDNAQQNRPTYLPASEDGSPRRQRELTGDAMFIAHKRGGPLTFATMTFDPSDLEVRAWLPKFDPLWTDTDHAPDAVDVERGGDGYPVPANVPQNPDGSYVVTQQTQQIYEATRTHAEVFEYKSRAFSAVMQSGTIFRNVGRPRIKRWRDTTDSCGNPIRIPQYYYPMAIDRDPDTGQEGYDIGAVEYQRRTFAHIHKATRPACMPREWTLNNANVGQRLDWVDQLTCARLPDRSVLEQFGMIGHARLWRALDGVCKVPCEPNARQGLYPGYEYLSRNIAAAYDDADIAVHPDIVHDFGAAFEDPNVLLSRLTRLVSGQAVRLKGCAVRIVGLSERMRNKGFCMLDASYNGRLATVLCDYISANDDSCVRVRLNRLPHDSAVDSLEHVVPRAFIEHVSGVRDHYSLHPYSDNKKLGGHYTDPSVAVCNRRGRMIHNHPKGPKVPNGEACGGKDCTKCTKAHFPKSVAEFTHIDADNVLQYWRDNADIMVVAWNAWVMLYFSSHINIEVVVSTCNVLAYLFKLFTYIWKGVGHGDTNRARIKVTKRFEEGCDEVGEHFTCKETCATEAFRRQAQMPSVYFVPSVDKLLVHCRRKRDNSHGIRDEGLTEFETYLARPCLSSLDATLFEDFHTEWNCSRTLAGAPKACSLLRKSASDPSCLLHYARDGRAVYVGADPTSLRENSQPVPSCYYWRRADAQSTEPQKLHRLKPLAVKSGDAFYLRKLIRVAAGRSFDELQTSTVTGQVVTAQERCRELGLLDDEDEANVVMMEAVALGDDAAALRSLFVQLTIEGYPMEQIFETPSVRAAMASDLDGDEERMVVDLHELFSIAYRADSSAMARVLPTANAMLENATTSTELQREWQTYSRATQQVLARTPELALDGRSDDFEQTAVVKWVLTGSYDNTVDSDALDESNVPYVRPVHVEWLVCMGDAGTGKTRVARRALAEVRARGRLARATAFTNLAATNYENGRTLHSLGCINVEAKNETIEKIALEPVGRMTPEHLELLRSLDFILYDECFSGKKNVLEVFLSYLMEVGCNVRVLILGDPQQIQPVVVNACVEEKIDASMVSSWIFHRASRRVTLTVQHRQHGDVEWATLVRMLGNGTAPSMTWHWLHSPSQRQKAVALHGLSNVFHEDDGDDQYASMREAIEWLFGRVDAQGNHDPNGRLCTNNQRKRNAAQAAAFARGVRMRAVLCATNVLKNKWNDVVRKMLDEDAERFGEHAGALYHAVNAPASMGDDAGEFELAEQCLAEDAGIFKHLDPTVPLERLYLQVGDSVMLAKTMCVRSGLVKNEVFTIKELRRYSVVLRDRNERLHTVPRARFVMNVNVGETVKVARKQLPFVHAWAITVNKSQGQTCECTLLDVRRPYWEHGHAYVALGRTQSSNDTAAFVDANTSFRSDDGCTIAIVSCVCHPELLAR